MIIICILLVFAVAYIVLICYICADAYLFAGIIKDNSRVRGGSAHNVLNGVEMAMLNRIRFNVPILSEHTRKYLDALKNIGVNIDLPLYKIELNGHKNLKFLSQNLRILKKIEELGYAVNIVITFSENKYFYYNNIKIMVSSFSFVSSVIKIEQTEFISKNVMFAINNLNINKPCLFKNNLPKNDTFFNMDNTQIELNKPYYLNYEVTRGVNAGEIAISSKKVINFKENFKVERIQITNLGRVGKVIKIYKYIPFDAGEKFACYTTVKAMQNGIQIINYKEGTHTFLTCNTKFTGNMQVTKFGVKLSKTVKILGKNSIYIYFVTSGNKKHAANLEQGEELINTSKSLLYNISLPKITTLNLKFDKLINETLPAKIIEQYLLNEDMENLKAFTSQNYTGEILNFTDLETAIMKCENYLSRGLVQLYFSLLYVFLGLVPQEYGFAVNLNKSRLFERSGLSIIKDNNQINVNIENKGLSDSFSFGGVTYHNIKFLPYRILTDVSKAVVNL